MIYFFPKYDKIENYRSVLYSLLHTGKGEKYEKTIQPYSNTFTNFYNDNPIPSCC